MKRKILIILVFLLSISSQLYSLGDYHTNYNNLPVKIVFDPANSLISLPIPLPNDANTSVLNSSKTALYLPIEQGDSYSSIFMKKAINDLGIKGFPPETIITIPLNTDTPIDTNTLYSNIFLIALKLNLSGTPTINTALPPVAGPKELIIAQDGNVIKIHPKIKLMADAQYVVLITKGVKTTDGQLVGRDAAIELLFKTSYSQLIKSMGLNTDSLLALFTFSTAEKTLGLSAFAKMQLGYPYTSTDTLSYNTTITYELQSMLAAVPLLPSSIGTQSSSSLYGLQYSASTFSSYNVTTLSTTYTPISVPTITIFGQNPNKVVIFQHGLGQNKSNAFALAANFLTAGYSIIAIDAPLHGDRVDSSDYNMDCNMDGIISSGECFFTTNLVNDRINIYQSVFDLTMLLKNIKSGNFDFNGDGNNDIPSDIYFVGQSLGSIVGSIFSKYNSEDLKKIALNVGGANLAALLDGTQIPDLQNAIKSLGYTKNSAPYFVFTGILNLFLDPADPFYHVDSSIKDKTILQTAYGDTIVPNTSNELLSVAVGYQTPTIITDLDTDKHIIYPASGWYQYGGITSSATYTLPHGFLLSPSADPTYYDTEFVQKATKAAQYQILNFFSDGVLLFFL